MSTKNLDAAIKKFDGKDTGLLAKKADSVAMNTEAVSSLINKLPESDIAAQAASWVLKHWWESGWQFSGAESKQLIDALLQAEDWQLRLHLLQLLPGLLIEKAQHKALYYHLLYHLEDKNKFVRAWTYNGLAEVAKQYSEYRKEVIQLFDLALKDEAASVKARIRNITI